MMLKRKKLDLSRETLRRISQHEAGPLVGGVTAVPDTIPQLDLQKRTFDRGCGQYPDPASEYCHPTDIDCSHIWTRC